MHGQSQEQSIAKIYSDEFFFTWDVLLKYPDAQSFPDILSLP